MNYILYKLDSRVKPENDINFKAQYSSQLRRSNAVSVAQCRQPAVQVIPGIFFLSSLPDSFFYVIAGLDPAIHISKHNLGRGNNGATRSL